MGSFPRKPIIAVAPHPLSSTQRHVLGGVVVACFPGKGMPRIEVLGRLRPHPSEVDYFFKRLEEAKSGAPHETMRAMRAEPATRAERFDPQFLHVLSMRHTARKIPEVEYQKELRRNLTKKGLIDYLSELIRDSGEAPAKPVNSVLMDTLKSLKHYKESSLGKYLVGLSKDETKATAESHAELLEIVKERYGVTLDGRSVPDAFFGTFEPTKDKWNKKASALVLKQLQLALHLSDKISELSSGNMSELEKELFPDKSSNSLPAGMLRLRAALFPDEESGTPNKKNKKPSKRQKLEWFFDILH